MSLARDTEGGDANAECGAIVSTNQSGRARDDVDADSSTAMDHLESLVEKRLQYIRLAQRFAEIANDSDSIAEGVSRALDCFCGILDWPIGHAYLAPSADSAALVDSGLWWIAPGFDAEPFVEVSARFLPEAGVGFLGSIMQRRQALWVGEEIAGAMHFRAEAAREIGLECGIAFPVLVESRVVGVLEFYSDDSRQCEQEVLDAVGQLGTQLGRTFEREEFEKAIARIAQMERKEFGRILHDSLSQQLTGVGMLARSLQRKLEDEDHPQAERSATLVESLREAHRQLRAFSRGLNPIDAHAGTLREAVAAFLDDTEQAFGIRCTLMGADELFFADEFVSNQVLYILREAIHNAAKHSNADSIEVAVRRTNVGGIEVEVRDDGDGFDVDAPAMTGMGLRTLPYRMRLINGSLRIESNPGVGTVVRITLKERSET